MGSMLIGVDSGRELSVSKIYENIVIPAKAGIQLCSEILPSKHGNGKL